MRSQHCLKKTYILENILPRKRQALQHEPDRDQLADDCNLETNGAGLALEHVVMADLIRMPSVFSSPSLYRTYISRIRLHANGSVKIDRLRFVGGLIN